MATAHRPVDAYYEVAAILGDEVLDRPSPDVGVLVTVIGLDGLASRWHLSHADAQSLVLACHSHRHLGVIRTTAYDQRSPVL